MGHMKNIAISLEEGWFYVGSICCDCLMAHENGDVSGNSPEWDHGTYSETCTKYYVLAGHPHWNRWHTECPHDGGPCPDDCDCERTEFANTKCDMCATWIAGMRHDYTFVER